MTKFDEIFNNILKSTKLSEIVDNKGNTIDNVKINDIVKTPDGFIGRYIKKKEYAIIDLGDGQVKQSEIDTLQLVEPADDEEKDK